MGVEDWAVRRQQSQRRAMPGVDDLRRVHEEARIGEGRTAAGRSAKHRPSGRGRLRFMRRMIRALFKLAIRLVIIQAVLVGLAVFARQFIESFGDEESDEFQLAALVRGIEFRSRATQLRGGTVIAAYGGIELDLREAALVDTGAELAVYAVMGGISVLVPEEWVVKMTTMSVMGGTEKHTTPEDDLPEDAPRLNISAAAVMGGIMVRSKARATAR